MSAVIDATTNNNNDLENIPPPPPTPPKSPTKEKLNDDDEDEATQNTQEQPQQQQNELSYAQQIAQLEKELGWDKDEDGDDDLVAINEDDGDSSDNTTTINYATAKKKFASEIDNYMKEITSWRTKPSSSSANNSRYADPLTKSSDNDDDDDAEEDAEDNEGEDKPQQEEVKSEIPEPPTKSAAKKKTLSKKPVRAASKKPSAKTSTSSSSTTTSSTKPKPKKKQTTVVAADEDNTNKNDNDKNDTLSARNNIPSLVPLDKEKKQKKPKSMNKLLQQTSKPSSLAGVNSLKLPPRKTPITFSELTKAVFKNSAASTSANSGGNEQHFTLSSVESLAGALEDIKKIDFTNRGLADLDAFDCVPSITHAYLGDNHLTSLEGVEVWLDCQVLVLHDNEIEKITELFVLRQLRFVDLRRNKLKNMIDIALLPESLEVIELAGNDELIDNHLSTDEQKEEFWEECVGRCPKLSSIDVVGTREEMQEKKRMKIEKILQIAEEQQQERGSDDGEGNLKIEDNNKQQPRKNSKDDDDYDENYDQDDPMLKGASDKNTLETSNFVEPLPETSNFASILKKKKDSGFNDDDDDDSSSSSSDDEDDDEEIKNIYKPEGDGLQAKITDADFDDDENGYPSDNKQNNNSNNTATSSLDHQNQNYCRPVSARNTRNLINSVKAENNPLLSTLSARPGSARAFASSSFASARPSSARQQPHHQSSTKTEINYEDKNNDTVVEEPQEEEEEDDVRLRLPVVDNLQSNVRSVTDDLLRHLDHARQNVYNAEKSRANHRLDGPVEAKSQSEKTAQQIMSEYANNTNDDVLVSEEQVDQFRTESRDLKRELLFAAQHQTRVASHRVEDMWSEGLEEFKNELRNSMFKKNQDEELRIRSEGLVLHNTTNKSTSSSHPQQQDSRPHSSSYERALRLLANENGTSVEGLDKYRKKIEKKKEEPSPSSSVVVDTGHVGSAPMKEQQGQQPHVEGLNEDI